METLIVEVDAIIMTFDLSATILYDVMTYLKLVSEQSSIWYTTWPLSTESHM